MKKDKITNAERGLAERECEPKDVIDKYINGARQAIRITIGKIRKYQKKKLEPPAALLAELEARVRKLHFYTVQRIRRMLNYSKEEIGWVMKQSEAIFKQDNLDSDMVESLAQDIRDRLVKKLRANLAWKIQKLRQNDHPFWQKEALNSLDILYQLWEDVDKESAEVMEIIAAYKKKERRRVSKLLGPGGLGKKYEHLQEYSAEDLQNLEKVRATADRMAEAFLKN